MPLAPRPAVYAPRSGAVQVRVSPTNSERTPAAVRLAAWAAIAAVGLLVTWGIRSGGFDVRSWMRVVAGEDIARGGLPRLAAYLTTPDQLTDFRPTSYLLYAADAALWGKDAAGWYATNLALHVVSALLLFELLAAVLRRTDVALAAALLLVASPVAAAVVGRIYWREDALATLFLIAALLVAHRALDARKPWMWIGAAALSVLPCLPKETSLLAPAFAVVLFWDPGDDDRQLARVAPAIAALAAGPAVYLAARWFALPMAPVWGGVDFTDPKTLEALAELSVATAAVLGAPATRYAGVPGADLLDQWRVVDPAAAVAGAALVAGAVGVAVKMPTAFPLRALAWLLLGAAPTFEMIGQQNAAGDIPAVSDMIGAYRLHLAAAGTAMLLAAPLVVRDVRLRAAAWIAVAIALGTSVAGAREAVGEWTRVNAAVARCAEAAQTLSTGPAPRVIAVGPGIPDACTAAVGWTLGTPDARPVLVEPGGGPGPMRVRPDPRYELIRGPLRPDFWEAHDWTTPTAGIRTAPDGAFCAETLPGPEALAPYTSHAAAPCRGRTVSAR